MQPGKQLKTKINMTVKFTVVSESLVQFRLTKTVFSSDVVELITVTTNWTGIRELVYRNVSTKRPNSENNDQQSDNPRFKRLLIRELICGADQFYLTKNGFASDARLHSPNLFFSGCFEMKEGRTPKNTDIYNLSRLEVG